MSLKSQSEKAQQLRKLHTEGDMLVLPNAWDAASARLYEDAGFPAVATTSAGVAFALGYADGQHAPREEVLFVVRRIAQTVDLPVTADIEAGYGAHSVTEVVKTVRGVLEVGAVGVNLEDVAPGESILVDVDLQIAKIRALCALGEETGIPLVINARTDAFHLDALTMDARFDLAVARANAYRLAGADCLFVPFVTDTETIAKLVAAIDGPVNILATAGSPPIAEMKRMGVRRVSVGGGPHRAVLALVRRIAEELRDKGTYRSFTEQAIPYAEMNALFANRVHPEGQD